MEGSAAENSAVTLLGRMALVALVVGMSVTAAATERVDLLLTFSGVLAWSVVPVLQVFTGAVLVRGTRGPRVRHLAQYFGTHWPWSLWLLALHALVLMVPGLRAYFYWLTLSAVVPIVATVRLLVAFGQEELHLTARDARRRVAQHQLLTLALAVLYVQFAVALWPRFLGFFV